MNPAERWMNGKDDDDGGAFRNGHPDADLRWPDGQIPYQFLESEEEYKLPVSKENQSQSETKIILRINYKFFKLLSF